MKIAIFCPSWVGDMVMATPALRAMRLHFPDAEIVAVVRPYVAGILDGLDLVDKRILHDPRHRGRWGGGASSSLSGLAFGRALRAEKIDAALLLTNTFRSAFWSWVAGARRRVGFDYFNRGWLLTDRVPPQSSQIPHPVIDNYLKLAAQFGCQTLTRQTELATSPEAEAQLHNFWMKQNLIKQ